MDNYKLVAAYEGTRYLGWQKTKMGPSIEEELEKALAQILQHPVFLQAASRTDAGVHAVGQVVNFCSTKTPSLKSINALLPKDISVLSIEKMPGTFHPTLDCSGKEYQYDVCFGPIQLPFNRYFSWHYPHSLNIEEMQKAAPFFIGEHDFSALTNEREENNIRHVTKLEVSLTAPARLRILVAGNRFLYKMVRNIAGTLVYVGCKKLLASDVPAILASKDRKLAGVTAPACGLSLKQVFYDES